MQFLHRFSSCLGFLGCLGKGLLLGCFSWESLLWNYWAWNVEVLFVVNFLIHRFIIEAESRKRKILIVLVVIEIVYLGAGAFEAFALTDVLCNESFDPNFFVFICIGLLAFHQPLLECHYLVEAVDVFVELFKSSGHQPFNLHCP